MIRKFGLGIMMVVLFSRFVSAGHLERKNSLNLSAFQLIQLKKGTNKQIGSWLRARVPGDVISTLASQRKIPHPYYDFNSEKVLWVNDFDWLYQTDFSFHREPGERVWLLFHGVDYQSQCWLNGREIFTHTGMFSRILVEITDLLRTSEKNRLEVKVFGQGSKKFLRQIPYIGEELERRKTLKTQMSFGWDFAPRLVNAGIWDRVEVFKTGAVMIRELGLIPEINGRVKAEFEFDSSQPAKAILELKVFPENFSDQTSRVEKRYEIKLPRGRSVHQLEFQIPSPHLWWSWDLGKPNLYRLQAEVKLDGLTSDRVEEIFGIREVRWEKNPGIEQDWKWVLCLNGKRLYLRGANWVPPEALLGQLSEERYRRLVSLAREANINIFRVWGGGNREWQIFYELCDRKGILVWQEFPFACIFVLSYPRSQKFLKLVEQEVGEIVLQLRNHPSIIIWSGGNEFSPQRNKKAVAKMEEVVRRYDLKRRFIPASPALGDSHNWSVWHGKGNLKDYFADEHALISEFGLQAFPSLSTIEKYISPELRFPIGKVYEHHNLGKKKMEKYLSCLPHPETLEGVIEASQKMQAYYLQRAIEHWRIRKYRYSGSLFWQFNEPWPAVCWSMIDYELNPKLSYEWIKNSYNPLLISADLPVRGWKPREKFTSEIYLVNDYHRKFSGLKIQVYIKGELVRSWRAEVDEDSVKSLGTISAQLPSDSPLLLELFVWEGSELVSYNFYDLEIYDPVSASDIYHQGFKLWSVLVEGKKKEQGD